MKLLKQLANPPKEFTAIPFWCCTRAWGWLPA